MHRLHTLLLLAYPLTVHFSLLSEQNNWALGVLLIVSLSQLLLLYRSPQHSNWLPLIPLSVLGLTIFGLFKGEVFALYLPPILISAGLLWLFASSLGKDREPIISAFARQVFNETEPDALHYTRRVTQLWSLFFLAMLLETLLLALFAPLQLWSLFTNILNYLFIVLLFTAEFSYRRWRFAQRDSLMDAAKKIIRTDWQKLGKGRPS